MPHILLQNPLPFFTSISPCLSLPRWAQIRLELHSRQGTLAVPAPAPIIPACSSTPASYASWHPIEQGSCFLPHLPPHCRLKQQRLPLLAEVRAVLPSGHMLRGPSAAMCRCWRRSVRKVRRALQMRATVTMHLIRSARPFTSRNHPAPSVHLSAHLCRPDSCDGLPQARWNGRSRAMHGQPRAVVGDQR